MVVQKMTNQTRGAVANGCRVMAPLLWSPTPTGSNLLPFHFLFHEYQCTKLIFKFDYLFLTLLSANYICYSYL